MNKGLEGKVYWVNALEDPRWNNFVISKEGSSIFHTREWLEALWRTYSYESWVVTTASAEEPIRNGIVLCKITSWITGKRLISLPFSDHCEPLLDSAKTLQILREGIRNEIERGRWKYAEIRPLRNLYLEDWLGGEFVESEKYLNHLLDLRKPIEKVYEGFHKDCIQRKIKRAEKEKLEYTKGTNAGLLEEFYRLQLITRKRFGLPPQPYAWFKTLQECMGNKFMIRGVLRRNEIIAAMIILSHGRTAVYKYGCSDARYHSLGSMPYLFWNAIQEVSKRGYETLDLGRSERGNEGLARFKQNLGGLPVEIRYWRYPGARRKGRCLSGERLRRILIPIVPDKLLTAISECIYRHIA